MERASTGMLCWLAPPQLQAQDIPHAATPRRQAAKEKLLLNDLQREFLWSYYREDRSEGGWWIPFEQRKTSLVLVSADSPELIRALEPTLWKPLLLDSAVIAFAKAGDPRYNQQILDVLQLRSFLDRGTWVFNPEPRSGSEFDRDWWGLRPEPWSVAEIKRQAQVFRSMQLVIAVLKTLNPALKGSTGSDLHQELRNANGNCSIRSDCWRDKQASSGTRLQLRVMNKAVMQVPSWEHVTPWRNHRSKARSSGQLDAT